VKSVRIAFLERLSGARSPEEFARTAAGFTLLQLYDSIKASGFSESAHGLALLALTADVQKLTSATAISTALLAVVDALPYWSLEAVPPIGRRIVHAGLLQYGRALADESEWDLALEIYSVVAIDTELEGELETSAVARFLSGLASRRCANWETSEAMYTRAYEMATEVGDFHIAVRSQIGRANNMRARGDLSGSERLLGTLMRRARSLCPEVLPRVVLARAGLANSAGRYEEAVGLAYRAFLIAYDDNEIRYQALVDLANLFTDFGLIQVASEALKVVSVNARERGVRLQASMNLLSIAVSIHDKASFNTIRRELVNAEYSVYQQTQYSLLLAEGLHAFGDADAANEEIVRAAALADRHQLFQLSFQIEDAAKRFRGEADSARRAAPFVPAQPLTVPVQVSRIADSIYAMATTNSNWEYEEALTF
jgi:hypothetical protein